MKLTLHDLLQPLTELSHELNEIYGSTLDIIILYGSFIRGEQTNESDINIAILLNKAETNEEKLKRTDLVVDYELMLDKVLSIIVLNTDHYKAWLDVIPLYRNIEKEGIILLDNNC